MLEILNRYSHGLASVPMLVALRERGCLARLAGTGAVFSTEELAREFSANRGYLDVAIRMMVCLEWLRPTADGRYEATPELADASVIPGGIMDLYRFPFDAYVQGEAAESFEPWLEQSERGWNSEHPFLPDYLDGLLIIPLLLALRTQGRLSIDGETLRLDVAPAVRAQIERLFVAKRWAARAGDELQVNRAGRFVIDRVFITATVASYKPMFGRADELLFGDAAGVFERDAEGHETHVDRTVNVIGSGFQHEKFFSALTDLVLRCFEGEDYESQPKYIVDMGCGDGTLLLRLYEAVRDRTSRGKVLDAHPVIPVAVDYNDKALVEASRTLAGIEHIAVHGDIGDPAALLETLRASGAGDLHRLLHVRSFLDHDRPYRQPEDREAAARRTATGGNVYIGREGNPIPYGEMLQSTVEHLRRWAEVVNEHGLALLEVHCLPPAVTARYRDESENFHFDVYHALSHQYLLDAPAFLACAAEAGLFCSEGRVIGFPKHLPYTRITLSHFERRPYIVRHIDDQFVLEAEGQTLASVRCERGETVRVSSPYARTASALDDLLQFVEQYWALADAGRVAGIDECRAAVPATDDDSSLAQAVARDVREQVNRYPFAAEDDPRAAERELGTFSFRWLLANLQRMGVMRDAGEVYDLDALQGRLGVAPRYHRYFDALMRRLEDEGLVSLSGRRMETMPLLRGYALTAVDEQVAEFKRSFAQRHPASVGLMNITASTLARYDEVLTGRTDITSVLFENADMDVFAKLFRGDVVSDYFNRIVADAARETVLRLKASTPRVRILEIGAGTGGTTVGVVEALAPLAASVEFCFTDISLSFVRNAQRLFAQHPWIEYRALNIEEDLGRQGFEPQSYDIVIAANVLHDTHDIEVTLAKTRTLLKPGGLLLLNEYTFVKECLSFSGALLHGWWLFEDPERRHRDSCLMSVPQWKAALEHSGFAMVEAFALPTQSTAGECTQSVMLCEALAIEATDPLPARITGSRKVEIIGALVEQEALRLLGEGRAPAYSAQRPLMDMGLDSIELVELKSLIERNLDVKLTPMFLFEHETPEKLAAALAEMVPDQQLPEQLPVARGPLPGQPEAAVRRSTGSRKVEAVEALVGQEALRLLGEKRAQAYSAQRPLMDMGLDSIELVELKSMIEQQLGVKLTPMFLFEHETTEKLAVALAEMVADEQLPVPSGPLPVASGQVAVNAGQRATDNGQPQDRDAVAIVGVACRFPGGASSPESFWKLLESGSNGIVSMPADRWRWPSYVDLGGKHRGIDKAGFLERIDEFDAPFFRISAKEAELMDPQQRLLLELSWEAMEDGGHRPSELSGRKIGVFAGVCHSDYRELLTTALDSAESYLGTGSAHSLLANRLSFFYDFKGPSVTVDTACSSALVALHDAVAAIRRGDCEQALVGAVNLLCSPTNSVTYYQAGMLSPTGTCRTFDANADGFVRGEGGAMLLVKPLRAALADGDAIYGLITGTAVNHGGQAASLTAPKPEAQASVVEAAWLAADAPLESIGYIEAHGTGTKLGDPVEIGGLLEAFRRLYKARGEAMPASAHCGLGSVKTTIGHLEGAAGLAGVLKILVAMQHRAIPATLNFERLNPDIDLTNSPFHVVAQNEPWPSRGNHPRRAGVSSFGFGGANSHAVIEEYPRSADDAETTGGEYLIPLSARSDEQLAEQARRLLAFLDQSAPKLADVAYTLQVGREPMDERLAFVVESREELIAALRAYAAGDRTDPNCYRGQASKTRATTPLQENGDLFRLASLWVKGAEIDWAWLAGAARPRRTHLPTYPFDRQRYWVAEPSRPREIAAEARLHPLVHRNTSDLREQRFSSTFTGEEFFLAGHRIGGRRLLPGVAYLEMAREAVARAAGDAAGRSITVRNLVWLRPFVVAQEPREMHIALFPKEENEVGFEIYADEVVHARGVAAIGAAAIGAAVDAPRLDVEALARRYQQRNLSADACYAAFSGMGIEYGEEHRAVEGLRVEADEVVARLSLSAGASNGFVLHPGLMDSALQAAFGFTLAAGANGAGPLVPFELRSAEIHGACTPRSWALVRRVAQERYDIDVCDDEGSVCVRLTGLTMRPVEGGREKPVEVVAELQEPSAGGDGMRQRLEAALTRMVTRLVKVRAEDVKPTSELGDLGFDSISYIEFVDQLHDDYGVEVEPTVFFEHRTLERFARYLVQTHGEALAKHFGGPSEAATPPQQPSAPKEQPAEKRQRSSARFTSATPEAAVTQPVPAEAAEPIAIVGMSGRFPMAKDVDELWENLLGGRNCIREIPPERWDWQSVYGDPAEDNKTNIKWGGFIDGVYEFDPQFFNISPREATLMDPQQRLLMMYAWKAIEDAGYAPSQLSGSNTAVFFATGVSDHGRVITRSTTNIDAYVATGTVASVGPNRMSYYLDLHGPSDPVETACSSSLVAIHRAVAAMRSGECEMAIVGGVNTILTPDLHISFTKAGMLSEDGRCKTFSAGADGYVRSEGVAALLLKPLRAAEQAGDHIYGVIVGSAENHGGRANTLTSPNPQAQAALLRRAYNEAGVDPSTVSYIEAHGTGTALGDPVEIEGLKAAFSDLYRSRNAPVVAGHCGVGSVKSNIGHLELAAGIAGVIKVLLQLKHKTLVPSLHCDTINPYIHLEGSPFYVVRETAEWRASGEVPRRAGVSSFGFGGANAHIVLEEYVPPAHNRLAAPARQAIVLSARTPERLRDQAEQLLAAVRERRVDDVDLADVAYTLQVGREPMEERLGLLVSSIAELEDKLQAFLNGEPQPYRGRVQKGDGMSTTLAADDAFQSAIAKWIEQGRLEMLLDQWIKGLELDWSRLHSGAERRRVSLPTYPFARERYAIETAAWGQAPARAAAAAVLHPLLHTNSSTLDEQSYHATFSGDEFFLSDHQVRVDGRTGHRVLPAVAYLEMVRAAVEAAVPGRAASMLLELRDVVWVQPIVVSGTTQIRVALAVSDDGPIDFEIRTGDAGQELVHCQGQAVVVPAPAPAAIDLEATARRMGQGRLEPAAVYAACARQGLLYGPSFQGLTGIDRGSDELLARLRLPQTVEDGSEDYVLHPSLMDSAMQGAVVLFDGETESGRPRMPFVLESLRVASPCSREMLAWVRHAPGSRAGDQAPRLDIDLCDTHGKVCVEMRGLTLRSSDNEVRPAAQDAAACVLAVPVWQAGGIPAAVAGYAEHHVILCDFPQIRLEALRTSIGQSEVLSLQSDGATIAQRYGDHALACFERIRSILKSSSRGRVLLQIVIPDREEGALLAGLSGLLKTAALENPRFVGQIILARPEIAAEDLGRYLRDEQTQHPDSLVRYGDGGTRQVARWQEIPAGGDTPPVALRDGGVYLITGGRGGLGVLFAKEILERAGDARVILAGRSAWSGDPQALIGGLAGPLAGRVSYRQVNVGDPGQVRELIESIRSEHGRLDGIVHGAGVLADSFILEKDNARFGEVLAPKVAGTYNLDQASSDVPLDFFVLLSSVVGAMGNAGQADYAAANGFMDQFAAYRNRQVAAGKRHGRTRSIDWPLWAEGGMQIHPAFRESLEKAIGMQPMQTAAGMQAFHRCLALPHDQVVVVAGDPARIRRALLAEPVPVAPEERPATSAVEEPVLAEKAERYLRKQLAGVLQLPSHKIDAQVALSEYGIDSILAMQSINKLEQTFGTLPKTLFFEHQTVRGLAGYFVAHHAQQLNALFASPSGETVPAVVPARTAKMPLAKRRFSPAQDAAPERPAQHEPVAIIGLSGRYPEAIDIGAYWANLREGKDCIVPVPSERWDWQAYYDGDRSKSGHHYSKWGGFISGVDEFDPLFFNISPREAPYIDPQERLFLQHAWKAVEDAGYTRARLQDAASERGLSGEVGVYVGVMWSEYQLFGVEADIPERKGVAGNVGSIANRVSFVLNLHGPSMTLDTMCSSSLSAVHYACQDLRLGRTSMAIAGGVNVSVHPNKYTILSDGQFISSDGHCQSFGIGGDGYIPGEGVGAVVLKRLSDAERDGDHIYGIIRGSALNHGGRTNGYTVPNPKAQASVIARAIAESEIDARHISYVEAHGTGTKLGDPIEIAALTAAFGEHTGDKSFCLIGSAKSNVGHCESAAGIAGLTKVLLQMQHGQIVPSLHSAQLNPHIDFPQTPFVVNQSLQPWEAPLIDGRKRPRIAGLSSFGAGGSNAHMIIEEYVAPAREPVAAGPVIIPLSARTPEQLEERVRDLLAFVTARRNALELSSVAWTLQVGREAMEERLCFAVSSIEQLIERLQAHLAGDEDIEDAYRGAVKRNRETLSLFSADDLRQMIDRWIASGQFAKLAELWARGIEPDWTRLYPGPKPRQVSLPTYPFARERHWIDVAANRPAAATAVLHPLLHANTSDLREQRYDSTFTGRESFLADHQVMGRKVLPGVAYLEMVRAAVEHAAPREEATALELRDTVWVQPVVVDGATRVSIALSEREDAIDFEVYSDQDVVHCQGRAVIVPRSEPARLDLAQLAEQMTEGRLDPNAVYDACARMGLVYGPAFRGITAVRRGNGQVLAHVRLPEGVEKPGAYVLHPNLLDSALQACVALFGDSPEPRLPFALKSLRILAPSVTEMVAWVRFAHGSALEVEIDLCDVEGNVCVELRGLALRALGPIGTDTLLAVPAWQASNVVRGGGIELTGHHVLSLKAEPHETIARQYHRHALALFEQVQAILRSKPEGKVLLQVVVTDELLAGLSGLLKTAALENPSFAGQLIVVPDVMIAEELDRRLEEERAGGLEALVRFENGVRQVRRWQEVAAEEASRPIAFEDGGVYLITGGRGALGMLFAKEILEQTASARVILTGRAKPDTVEASSRISYRQVDLGRLDHVERLIAEIKADYGRLDGILHSAGMISDQFILKKTGAAFSEVLEPKVAGTVHLDEASRDLDLDFFVLFSSFAGAMGNVGQADYAAANGFMDRFAAYRNRQVAAGRRHGRTLSINWPLWEAGGMSIDAASRDAVRQATGMQPMQAATGLRAFHRSLALSYDQVLVAEGDKAQLRRTLAAERPAVPERAPAQAIPDTAAIGSAELLEKTQQYFRRQFSELLKVAAQKIDPEAALEEYGIDSVLALRLINKLEQTFGALAKTLLFEYQTIRDLSRYFIRHHAAQLQALFAPTAAPSALPAQAPVPAKPVARRRAGRLASSARSVAAQSDAIAIIGLSGRYPEAVDVAAYWENLRSGKDCIVEVPKERWDWREYFSDDRTQSGHHYSKWGGFVAGVDEFDPLFFNISPKEAKYIDPQERLFLQHAWMAVEDAGYTRAGLQASNGSDTGGRVGVYAGVMWGEYQLFGVEASAQGNRLGIAGTTASVANRVSYALNLHGPSMTVDTMCSSSLTAIHIACQDLKQGRCSLAIAGGVNVSIHPNKYLALSAGQFISSDGHCQSFGEGGDGYIPGEGVGVVVLKRLSEARRDGDHIYGIIRGSALNHGGKTNGYTVPNPQAQAGAVSQALEESGTDARHVTYIEAHGTGTKLGDPIEIAALSKAFGRYTQDKGFCLIGSAKSNIGHCESAAGIAGLTKVLLQMQHRQIVPSLHSTRLNSYIDFDSTPFVVNQTLRPWESPVVDGRTLPRIAGLSSFGAGGSNAHLIIEEYPAPVEQPVTGVDVAIVLSARTAAQLQQRVRDLLEFIRPRQATIDLAAVAYTLQVGREPMEERFGFVAGSIEQLVARLEAYDAGDGMLEYLYRGQVKSNKEALSVFAADPDLQQTVEKWIANRNLSRLLELWVKGLEVDWARLYGDERPRRITLPVYPFARERHWIDPTPARPSATSAAAVLHPLLHTNTSDLTAQSYRSTFTGEEHFVAAHGGRKVLPAVACLEMARAAVEHATSAPPESPILELRDVIWAQPVVVGEHRPVDIGLFAEDNGPIAYEIYSQDGEREIVHCQGRASWSRETAPAAVDLDQLRRQGQRVVALSVPLPPGGYVLHPALLDAALRAVQDSLESREPFSLQLLRIVSSCTPEMFAWVRPSAGGGAVDVDLCDDRGQVAVQMRGLTLLPGLIESVETVIEQTSAPAAPALAVYREIPFLSAAPAEANKPAAISLLAAPAAAASPASTAARARITLSNAGAAASSASATSPVRLYESNAGIFSIEIAASRAQDGIVHLLQALERVRQEPSLKVLMLSGIEHCFLAGDREEYNRAIDRKLFQRLAEFPYPVIAELQGDVIGAGFLAAALCDFLVCSEDARYGYTEAERRFHPTFSEATLLAERFGTARVERFLFGSADSSGRQLRSDGWTCPIVPWFEVNARAGQLASALAAKPQEALRLLKEHLSRRIAGLARALTRVESTDAAAEGGPDEIAIIRYGRAGVKDALPDLSAYRAVVLVTEEPDVPEDVALNLQRLVADAKIPVVAALPGDAHGNVWLVSLSCDARVYARSGVYSPANAGPAFEQAAVAVFSHRFGHEVAGEILLTGADYSGAELRQRGGAAFVEDSDQVLPVAMNLAAVWARLPRATVAGKKQQTAAALQERTHRASDATEADWTEAPAVVAPASIPLQSSVVTATVHPDGIVVVRMEDREAKNMFSDALAEGIREVFAHIDRTPSYKVVILTGYDSYFASGGTKESLVSIQEGKMRFTDSGIFHVALECRLPVIAAMQGHGIGAGWSMGMFADIVLLSEESRYVSPYMSYGFTPGAGATYSLTEKLGRDLAHESLLTAQQVAGRELKDRGLALRILPRAEVAAAAMTLAQQIARASRGRLLELKRQLTAHVHQPLEETYRRELEMHEKTFVGRADTLAQIHSHFDQDVRMPAVVPQTQPEPAPSMASESSSSVLATLRTLLANELLLQESDVDDDAQFVDLGLDSITGVTWVRKINEKYQTSIEATKIYSYPTLAQLSRYVGEEARQAGTLAAAIVPAAVPRTEEPVVRAAVAAPVRSRRGRSAARFVTSTPATREPEPIAVIGAAGQFPQARNLEEFWRNIAEGRNCITQVRRWDVDTYYRPGDPIPGKTTSQWMGALDDYDLFDPLFFNISPTEAECMDPQQRLFLQACWHSIENAGYDPRNLSGSRCGVFVGCGSSDYQQLSREHSWSAQGFTGSAMSILAARISYFLNLRGPSMAIDTACSSSLVALANACDSLIAGGSDLALAGGVYVMAGPEMHIRTAQSGMLSPEGKCFAFDDRADGFAPGEGVGVVLLKRLSDAERDGDIIQAVIRGWGVNQDGKTNGITAPNPESQTRLEQDVYDRYRIDPAEIQLIEAHGTGTKLGDPIEVEGLQNAFRKYTQKTDYCALGSVKSNIGHCLTAAGIAGVLKLVLALQRKELPPTINFERLNEHINLRESPFYVNTQLREWTVEGAAKRQAAISSFGFSGTNAHMVIAEYPALPEAGRPAPGKCVVPISARTVDQLTQKVRDLLELVRGAEGCPELADIAYTLQVGRAAMEERLGFIVSSLDELEEKLQAWLDGRQNIEDAHRGQVKHGREAIGIISQDDEMKDAIVEKLMARQNLSKLLRLWAKGLDLDWSRLYGERKPRRVSLPVYPFARERYWIDAPADAQVVATGIHPLLHRNASDLHVQRYSATFTGDEDFLKDHRVRTDGHNVQKVLPGVAYLEMARAAIQQAWPAQLASSALELRDTVWVKPIVVERPEEVSIALFPAEDDCVDYEISTTHDGQSTVHCQGQASFIRGNAQARIDLAELRERTGPERLEASGVYSTFAAMGLHYGPAHQGIIAIQLGDQELLAELALPAVVEANRHAYVLHPSLLDSALQASIGLIADASRVPDKPAVPFALETLRVLSPCTKEMLAWVRVSGGSIPGELEMDVDLCDAEGNVCVQMRGFVLRLAGGEGMPALSGPRLPIKNDAAFDGHLYTTLLDDVAAGRLSVDEAAELG